MEDVTCSGFYLKRSLGLPCREETIEVKGSSRKTRGEAWTRGGEAKVAAGALSLEIGAWRSLEDRWCVRPWQIRAPRKCVGVDEG